jgi:hypothetical protein
MELLGDMGQVESCFCPLETMSVSVQDRCTDYAKRTIGSEIVLDANRGYSKVMRLKWKLVSVYLEIVLNFTQDRCTVCTERRIGSKIILDAPDGTPR